MKRLRGPDGHIYEVDDEEFAEVGLAPGWSEEPSTDAGTAGVLGAMQGLTGGFADEIGAGFDTAKEFIGSGNLNPEVQDVLSRYKQLRGENRELMGSAEGEHVNAFRGAKLPAEIFGFGKLGVGAKLGATALKSGLLGGAYGAGHSEADITDPAILRDIGTGAAFGAGGGAAGHKFEQLTRRGLQTVGDKAAPGLEKLSHGLPGRGPAGSLASKMIGMGTTTAGATIGGAVGGVPGAAVGSVIGGAVAPFAAKFARQKGAQAVQKGADAMLGPIARSQAKRQLSGGNFGVLTGENPGIESPAPGGNLGLQTDMAAQGLKSKPVTGFFDGKPEHSYMMENPSTEQMVGLGQKYGQSSVMSMQGGKNALVNVTGENAGNIQPMTGAKVLRKPPTDGSPYSEMSIHGKKVPFQAKPAGPEVQAPTGVKAQLQASYEKQLREKGNALPAQTLQDAGMAIQWISQQVRQPYYAKQAMQGVIDEPLLARKIVAGLAAGLGVQGIPEWEEEEAFAPPPGPEPTTDEPPQNDYSQPFGGMPRY